MVPTQISCAFFPHWGFFWQVVCGLRSNRISFVSGCSALLIFCTLGLYRDPLIVLPMREPSIFRGIAVSLLRPVIGSNVEIDVVALDWVADVRKQIRFAGRKN